MPFLTIVQFDERFGGQCLYTKTLKTVLSRYFLDKYSSPLETIVRIGKSVIKQSGCDGPYDFTSIFRGFTDL